MTGHSFRRLVTRNYARMLYSNFSHTAVDVLAVSILSDGSEMTAFGAGIVSPSPSMTFMSLVPAAGLSKSPPVRLAVLPDEVRDNVEVARLPYLQWGAPHFGRRRTASLGYAGALVAHLAAAVSTSARVQAFHGPQ